MTKREMIEEMFDRSTDRPLVFTEYRREGYTEEAAREKTIKWYLQNYKKEEIKDMYEEAWR